jgi:putative transposase
MSFYQGCRTLPRQFGLVLSSAMQAPDLPFSDVLTEDDIKDAFDEEDAWFAEEEDDIYTPQVTLWAFLSQVLHKGTNQTCLGAVARVIVLLTTLGREPCLKNSGAYCKARAKFPEVVIERLAIQIAHGCEKGIPEEHLWKGLHVKLADGTTVSMPDTESNQEEYPQSASQEPGIGFPVARMVLLLSLATAMVCGMAIGPCAGKETGELALMRQLLDQLDEGDVLLADRYFCSYFMIALLLRQNVDMVARLHHARKEDAYRVKRLGYKDYLIRWQRPDRPAWMDRETYKGMPETITLRQIEVNVTEEGFRTKSFSVVTTLLDTEDYPRIDIASLYRQRWLAEVDILAIKESLGMDVLSCKSPAMVRKEIWVYLLEYNLVRKIMLQAAVSADLSPSQLSFTGAMQALAAGWNVNPFVDEAMFMKLVAVQIESLTAQTVGNRPNRVEPRAVKRRPKPNRLLNMTRNEARELLRQGVDPYEKQK